MGTDALDVLLIEDNPGDARLIREMLRDETELLQRVDAGASTDGEAAVHHEQRLSEGLDRLGASDVDIDVVLLDLGLPDSTGLDTLAAVVDEVSFVPVVVLTGLRDEAMGIEAIQRGAQDYLVKDEVTGDLLVRSIHHAIERNRQERERARQLEQLEALNRLNRVSQDITHAVITTSTREELEREVCDRLVDSDAYRFAWIGEVDRVSDRITPRVAAGVEDGYLDEVTVAIGDDDTAHGPAGNAVQSNQVSVVQDILTDPKFEPWRAEARERGYRSLAAVPISHEDLLYGVVIVYGSSPNAFTDPEVEILSRMGDVIGHALTAIERRDALVGDVALQLEFRTNRLVTDLLALSADGERSLELGNFVRNEEDLIAYGQSHGIPGSELRDAAASDDGVDDVRILSTDGDDCEFELVVSALRPLTEAVADHGGHLASATVAEGTLRFVVEFPPGRDKRQLVQLVEDHCDGAAQIAQRTVQRDGRDAPDTRSVVRNQLTDKQRTALETAYFAGFFDWPRETTGQEVAERLGVSAPTFTQHLRTAERKFFETVFDGWADDDSGHEAADSADADDGDGDR